MSPEEQERLEQRYLAEDDTFEAIRAAEEALIQDYWQGRLSAEERQRFETHYLASPVRRDRAMLVRDLAAYAARKAEPRRAWNRSPAWLRAAVWAVAALGVSVVTLHEWGPGPGGTGPRTSPAPVTPGGNGAAPSPESVVWTRLRPGLSRAAAQTATTLGLGSGPLRVRLDLPSPGRQAYTLVLESAEGREVWRSGDVSAEEVDGAFVVRVEIPRAPLEPGDYVIRLRPVKNEPDAEAEYFFRLTRG